MKYTGRYAGQLMQLMQVFMEDDDPLTCIHPLSFPADHFPVNHALISACA
jgi:hypothetical protein